MKYINRMTVGQVEELNELLKDHAGCITALVDEVAYNCGRKHGATVSIVVCATAAVASAAVGWYVTTHSVEKKKEK